VAQPRPAGGGWISGPRPGCSTNSRRCCWTSSAKLVGSTRSGSAWTPSACGRSKGGPDRRKPGRSGQGRVQAAPSRRARRAAGRGGLERGQCQRRHHARGGAGRHPADRHAQRAAPPPAPRSMLTRPTIIAAAGPIFAGEASARGSPDAASSPRRGWAATVGRSSAPAPGWADGGGCASATSVAPSGSTRWPCWPARSSASRRLDRHGGDGHRGLVGALPAGYGCQRVTRTTKRRLWLW
jgi:hypothetical protein